PGRYRASLPLPAEGTTVVQISSPDLPDGGMAMAHTRSYPREFVSQDTNEALLREIASAGGGRFDAPAGESFQRGSQAGLQRSDLGNWFLIAALCLMPLDIFLRRRVWALPGR